MPSLRAAAVEAPLSGHLSMGTPTTLTVDGRKLTRNGRAWLPVMGEFHFSRYPRSEWRPALLRIRAGGIDLVATYLFWNHHEEQRGTFRFDDSLDVRAFVELCGELGLAVAVRIGPWSHGECRNGGFPDWLTGVDCVPRTDDPAYLTLVERYFQRIGAQLAMLSYSDGGPIVAVQVENELYDQPEHLRTLRRMARDAGIEAPLWTATAWGGAELPRDTVLPLYGGYPDAFWIDADSGWAREMRRHFFFTPIRDDHAIGADLRATVPTGRESDVTRYPYATCELGGGMAIAYHRRPLVRPDDVAALALTKLGSGSVWQGYYLYHGCSQRTDLAQPNQESHATGYPNDMPVVNYDFQAPIGEYGQVRPSWHALRLQHMLIKDSGADLADMPMHLPDEQPEGLDDRRTVRWAVRSAGGSSFLFVNNHQPHERLPDHHDVRFTVDTGSGPVRIPGQPVVVRSGAYFVWPIGYALTEDVSLVWASAQPVTRMYVEGRPLAVFAATDGIEPQFAFRTGTVISGAASIRSDANMVVATAPTPGTDCVLTADDARILVLPHEHALRLSRLTINGTDILALADEPIVTDGDEAHVTMSAPNTTVSFLPDPRRIAENAVRTGKDGLFTTWRIAGPAHATTAVVECLRDEARHPPSRTGGPRNRASAPVDADFEKAAVYRITVPAEAFDDGCDVLLRVRYTGDVARAYVAGRLVADHFWFGPDWEIGLNRFLPDVVRSGVEIRVLPTAVDPPVAPGLADADQRTGVDAVTVQRIAGVVLRIEMGGQHG